MKTSPKLTGSLKRTENTIPYFLELKIALKTWLTSRNSRHQIGRWLNRGGGGDPIDLTSEYFIECDIDINQYQYTEVGGSYDYGEPEILHLTDLTVTVDNLTVTSEDMTDLTPNYTAAQLRELAQIIEQSIYNFN